MCRESLGQSLPVAASANAAYKTALELGLGDSDFAAVQEAICKKSQK